MTPLLRCDWLAALTASCRRLLRFYCIPASPLPRRRLFLLGSLPVCWLALLPPSNLLIGIGSGSLKARLTPFAACISSRRLAYWTTWAGLRRTSRLRGLAPLPLVARL